MKNIDNSYMGGAKSVDDEFPYKVLRYLGAAIVLVGLIALLLGVADLAYTLILYQFECTAPSDWIREQPCKHEKLLWTWICSGIWVGLIAIVVGALGAVIAPGREDIKQDRDAFAIGAGLLAFLFAPALIILPCLQAFYQVDLFYMMVDNEGLVTNDEVKLLLPILLAICGLILWILALAALIVACCCAPVADVDVEYGMPRPTRPLRVAVLPPVYSPYPINVPLNPYVPPCYPYPPVMNPYPGIINPSPYPPAPYNLPYPVGNRPNIPPMCWPPLCPPSRPLAIVPPPRSPFSALPPPPRTQETFHWVESGSTPLRRNDAPMIQPTVPQNECMESMVEQNPIYCSTPICPVPERPSNRSQNHHSETGHARVHYQDPEIIEDIHCPDQDFAELPMESTLRYPDPELVIDPQAEALPDNCHDVPRCRPNVRREYADVPRNSQDVPRCYPNVPRRYTDVPRNYLGILRSYPQPLPRYYPDVPRWYSDVPRDYQNMLRFCPELLPRYYPDVPRDYPSMPGYYPSVPRDYTDVPNEYQDMLQSCHQPLPRYYPDVPMNYQDVLRSCPQPLPRYYRRESRSHCAEETPRLIEIREYEGSEPHHLVSVKQCRPLVRRRRSRNY